MPGTRSGSATSWRRGSRNGSSAACWLALLLIAGTLFVYYNRNDIAPGYGQWIRARDGRHPRRRRLGGDPLAGARPLPPPLPAARPGDGGDHRLRRPPAGDRRAVVILALRIAGVNASTLAVGGAFTAVLLGLAAQQALGGIFAGIVLQSTRPFRVGERVRLVGGALAGSLEGTVSSLGLFYTTLSQGADRLMVPNNVLLSLVVVPLREPDKVDVRVRFPVPGEPEARSRNGCCRRSPSPPVTSPASRWRNSTPTGSSSGSTRRRCAPKTARSWPRRCWRRCAARNRPSRDPQRP